MGKAVITTQTVANPADQRVQVESLGAGSQFISPGATVAAPGAVSGSVGSFSQLHQTYSSVTEGMTGDDVRGLLLEQETVAGQNLDRVTQLSSRALESSQAALQTLATAKTAEPADWTRFVPLIIIGVIALAVAAGGKRRAA